MADGPLSGIPIVDFTENMAGPFGTMILADQGADVVKVGVAGLKELVGAGSLSVLPFSNQPGRR
jgi:crotonobetainyl-CoA:carnitine CoA-transferase CaiB-like acyl-CoA transferase